MNIDVKQLTAKLLNYLQFLMGYARFIFIVFVLILCSFLVFQINRLSNVEPSEDEVTEKLDTVQRPRIDQKSVDKIQQLQDQNIQAETLFQQARDNPFSE